MKIGFIGYGNMARAMVSGMVDSSRYSREMILVSSRSLKKDEKNPEDHTIVAASNRALAEEADIIFLTVKPYMYKEVIEEIKDVVKEDAVIVTVAPGISTKDISQLFNREMKVVRTMPNTPCKVREGMTCYCTNERVSDEDKRKVSLILTSFGMAEEIHESQMDAIVPLTGSSPAYVFMMIEAMADEAVLEGIERNKAYKLAAQAVLGSAKMVLETRLHPGILKDMVCSPKGTTIEAVRALEKYGFRSSIIEAMKACSDKIKQK